MTSLATLLWLSPNGFPDPPEEQRKISILIVDDEPDIISVFKKSLEKIGYSTYGFVNPSAALEHFTLNPKEYQIVISDIRMPGMNGFQLVKEIKKINPDVKVILMSAFEIGMPEFKKVLPSIQIDAIFDKPVKLERLNEIISAVAK